MDVKRRPSAGANILAGLDPEDVAMRLQKNLLEGNLSIPENVTREEFVDD